MLGLKPNPKNPSLHSKSMTNIHSSNSVVGGFETRVGLRARISGFCFKPDSKPLILALIQNNSNEQNLSY